MRRVIVLLILIALAFASHYRLLSETLSLALAMFRVMRDDRDRTALPSQPAFTANPIDQVF